MVCPQRSPQDAAQEVADLFRQGRQGEAVALLNNQKQGQPSVVQQALDRMVSADLRYCISPYSVQTDQGLFATPAEIGTVIRQINEAGNPPEMPDTSTLSDQQKFDVYASIVQIHSDQAAQNDLANGNSVILGLRSETSTLANNGSRTNTDSAGCTTVHPDDYGRFENSIRTNPDQTIWNYVLTEVSP